MFYVSDISGAQVLYADALARLQQESLTIEQEEQELIARAPGLSGSDRTTARTTASSEVSGGDVKVVPGEQIASSVGTAGASALYRSRGQGEGLQAEVSDDAPSRRRVRRYPQTLSRVRPAAALRREASDLAEEQSPTPNPYAKLDIEPKQREKAIIASQIMSETVITLSRDQTIAHAGELFEQHRFRHLPVISDEGKLIGILSDRDYLLCRDKEMKVEEVMTVNVLTARPNTEIRLIAEVLFKERIGGMPIVDEKGDLVGMLTRSDILCALVNKAPLEIWA